MYCKNCGKEVENGELCLDCQQKQLANIQEMETTTEQKPKNTANLGGGIASVILSGSGCAFGVLAFIYVFMLLMIVVQVKGQEVQMSLQMTLQIMLPVVIAFVVMGIVFSIIGLIKGISSIKSFKNSNKQGAIPVLTLIFGIEGTATGGLGLYFVVVTICVLAAMGMILV